MKPKIPNNYGITEIDNNPTFGYEVRIKRKKQQFNKLFSFKDYKSKKDALKAAKKYRDKVLKDNPPMTRAEFSETSKAKSKSGTVGVSLVTKKDKRNKKTYSYDYWQAWWSPEPGVNKTRSFSINKHGYDEALELAKKARKEGLKQMQDPNNSYINLSKAGRKNKI